MQQFMPVFARARSARRPGYVSVQKCFRTSDIDEVGDRSHLTFFEMLGNFSIGDYFKEESSPGPGSSSTTTLGLDQDRIWITIHPTDDEANAIWLEAGIPQERIKRFGDEDNWWGPPGQDGPCGPDTELYYDRARVRRAASPSDPAGLRLRPPGVLEPGVHAVLPGRDTASGRRCRSRTSTPAWAWSGPRSSARVSNRSTTPTCSCRSSRAAEAIAGVSVRQRRARRTTRCGSWPTTRAAMTFLAAGRRRARQRAAATTSCGASCGARSATAASSASSAVPGRARRRGHRAHGATTTPIRARDAARITQVLTAKRSSSAARCRPAQRMERLIAEAGAVEDNLGDGTSSTCIRRLAFRVELTEEMLSRGGPDVRPRRVRRGDGG